MPATRPALETSQVSERFVCTLCGAHEAETVCTGIRDWEHGVDGEWDYVRCRSCGLVSLDPFPDFETLRRAYPDTYASWSEQSSRKNLLQTLRGVFITHRNRQLARLMPPQGSVLDVGCGDGSTLERLGQCTGGRLVGIDFSRHAVDVACAKGLDVRCGTLDALSEPDGSFDLILMIGYLEHSWTPECDLAGAYRLLKPGGTLFGVVPNFDSLDRRLFGRYWAGTHAPRHILQFTPQTLRKLLRDQGFDRPRLISMMSPTYPALSIQNWLQSGAAGERFRVRLENGRAFYYPALLASVLPLQVVIAVLGLGGLMKFTAGKS